MDEFDFVAICFAAVSLAYQYTAMIVNAIKRKKGDKNLWPI